MGTSSSHSGPGDGPGLLPSWATGDGNGGVSPNDGAEGGDTDASPGDATEGNETLSDGGQTQPPTPPSNWRLAKSGMTRYATSGGRTAKLKSAGAGYVRAKGGSRKAASSATSGRSTSRSIGSFLQSAVQSGVRQALESIGLRDTVGQSAERVLARLVDALAPSGATKEEAAARCATIGVLEYLYENVIGEDGDLAVLEQMDRATIEAAIKRSVSGYIYNRWLDELGLSIEKGAVSEAAAVQLERDVKAYVESCVSLELGDKTAIDIDWAGRDGRRIVDRVYADAYAMLETGT